MPDPAYFTHYPTLAISRDEDGILLLRLRAEMRLPEVGPPEAPEPSESPVLPEGSDTSPLAPDSPSTVPPLPSTHVVLVQV